MRPAVTTEAKLTMADKEAWKRRAVKKKAVDLILPTQTRREGFLPLYHIVKTHAPPYTLEIASMHQDYLNVLGVGLGCTADKVDRAASSKSCNQRPPIFHPSLMAKPCEATPRPTAEHPPPQASRTYNLNGRLRFKLMYNAYQVIGVGAWHMAQFAFLGV